VSPELKLKESPPEATANQWFLFFLESSSIKWAVGVTITAISMVNTANGFSLQKHLQNTIPITSVLST
jgi:hypothetical protein